MPFTTDDIIDEITDHGYSICEAAELAYDYIAAGFTTDIAEYLEYKDDISNEGFIEDPELSDDIFNASVFDDAPAGVFKIGAKYSGIKEFKLDDRLNMYIPSSYYCLFKCYYKSFDRNKIIIEKFKKNKDNSKMIISTKNISPHGVNLSSGKKAYKHALQKYLFNTNCTCKRIICDCDYNVHQLMPEVYKIKDNNIITINKKKNTTIINDSILLIHVKEGFYHSVLLKSRIPENIKNYNLKLDLTTNYELDVEQCKMKRLTFKKRDRYVISYDIETYEETQENSSKSLKPYALAYSLVDLINEEYTPPIIIDIIEYKNIFNEMVNRINKLAEEKQLSSIQIFAHYGSKFDNIYFKSANNVTFTHAIINGTDNKSITCKSKEGVTLILKDTYPFLLNSLKNSIINYQCPSKKIDLNIAGYTIEKYKSTTEWKEYLIYDVKGLSEVMIKLEKSINDFGRSITTCLGSASLAWNIARSTCYWLNKMCIPKSPSLHKFMRQSCYGGRVLHWRKRFNMEISKSPMISLDYNSLYPTALAKFSYPVGECILIKNPDTFDVNKSTCVHYIIECDIDAGNVRHPIHPYKDDKGNLIYKAGKFTGIYNEVDILEMLADGYKINKIHRGVYWLKTRKAFKGLIQDLYKTRKELKAKGDSREYVVKIIMNSIYGKFLESIDSSTKYSTPKVGENVIKKIPVGNNQWEYTVKHMHALITKPTHIAGYVTAYSRKLMNECINSIGRNNIWYQDTDSIYTTIDQTDSVQLGGELGEVKNDYGEGVYITKAIFLDLKRYLLIFNNNTAKIKFLGLNFKSAECLGGQSYLTDPDIIKNAWQLFEDLERGCQIPIGQERWKRTGLNIEISESDILYSTKLGKRGEWCDGEYYALNYNKNIPSTAIDLKNTMNDYNVKVADYEMVNKRMYSSTPLVYEKDLLAKSTKIPTNFYMKDGFLYRYISGMLCKCSKYGIGDEPGIPTAEEELGGLINVGAISISHPYALQIPVTTDELLRLKRLIQ